MIRALDKGALPSNSVEAVCDDCGLTQSERCKYERGRRGNWTPDEGQVINRLTDTGWTFVKKVLRCPECEVKRRGAAVTAPAARVEAVLRQPIPGKSAQSVIAAVKPKPPVKTLQEAMVAVAATLPITPAKEEPMPTLVTAPAVILPQPTREQRRRIMDALRDAYDVKAERYIGTATDRTLAESIGHGVRSGWVAEVREEFFGSDGGNSEMAELRLEIEAMKRAIAEMVKEGQTVIDLAKQTSLKVADMGEKHGKLIERYQAVCAAVGPKAGAK